jgi:hypothetical protein
VLNIFFSDADNNNMLDNFAAVVHQAMQCQLCPHTSACGDRSEHVWPRNRSSESWPMLSLLLAEDRKAKQRMWLWHLLSGPVRPE